MARHGPRAGGSGRRARDAIRRCWSTCACARRRRSDDGAGDRGRDRRASRRALAGHGRLLVRYSGTEPLLRVMLEGKDQATVQAWAEEIADAVHAHAGVAVTSDMIALSVNVNKVATLRNSRGGARAERARRGRHVRRGRRARHHGASARRRAAHPAAATCIDIAARLLAHAATRRGRVQHRRRSAARSARPGARRSGPTSARSCRCRPARSRARPAGRPDTPVGRAGGVDRARCKRAGVRVSLFVDPDAAPVRWAARLGADRVELYTEPFARAFAARRGRRRASRSRAMRRPPSWRTRSASASTPATISISTTCGSSATLPHLDEVSIGHALISRGAVRRPRSRRPRISRPCWRAV